MESKITRSVRLSGSGHEQLFKTIFTLVIKKIYLVPFILLFLSGCSSDSTSNSGDEQMYFPPNDGSSTLQPNL